MIFVIDLTIVYRFHRETELAKQPPFQSFQLQPFQLQQWIPRSNSTLTPRIAPGTSSTTWSLPPSTPAFSRTPTTIPITMRIWMWMTVAKSQPHTECGTPSVSATTERGATTSSRSRPTRHSRPSGMRFFRRPSAFSPTQASRRQTLISTPPHWWPTPSVSRFHTPSSDVVTKLSL